MNRISTYLLVLLPLLASCTTPIEFTERYEVPANVSAESYEQIHRSLYTADGNSRGFTTAGSVRVPAHQHNPARDFIASSFRQMGYITALDEFSFAQFGAAYTNCANVVAIKPGTTGTGIHIIGAHYDTVDTAHEKVTRCPGADDNGSGVAALLETARVLQHEQFRDTIIFVAFDAEEKGAYGPGGAGSPGALHFLQTYITDAPAAVSSNRFLRSSIRGMISIDMIGYDDPGTAPYVVIGRRNVWGSAVGDALEQAAEIYSELIPLQAYGYNQSDHMPFHDADIDAVQIMEYDFKNYWDETEMVENPHYHTDADSVDSPGYIAYPYATAVTKCIVGYLCHQAGLVSFQSSEDENRNQNVVSPTNHSL